MSNRRVRIGLVLWSGRKGGAETYVLKLAETLSSKRPDFDVDVIFFTHAFELGAELGRRGVKIRELGLMSGYDIPGLIRFVRDVNAQGYDTVHFHSATATSIILLKAFSRSKVLYTEHSSLLPEGAIKKLLYRLSIKCCHRVYFVGKKQREMFVDRLTLCGGNHTVLTLGIDCGIYNDRYDKRAVRARLGYPQDACIIGYVGRFAGFKRIDKIISAVSLLKKRISDIRLLIVGFGDDIERLKSMTTENNIAGQTEFIVSPADVKEIQQSLDFLVHASEHESLGLSVLEAMALGKPVIINGFESAEEIVDNGEDGIIIKDASPAEIAEAIERLWNDIDKYGQISRKASNRIKNRHDFSVHFNALVKEYESITN